MEPIKFENLDVVLITAKQEIFAKSVLDGVTSTAAYITAYQTRNMSQKTIWEEASRLRRHPKVAARIIDLEAEKAHRQRIQALSREERILKELEAVAFGDGPVSAKLKAIELLGKNLGLFKPKEVPKVERSQEEIEKDLIRTLSDLVR